MSQSHRPSLAPSIARARRSLLGSLSTSIFRVPLIARSFPISWPSHRWAGRAGRLGRRDADAQGIERGLRATLQTELGENVADVRLDGLLGDMERARDFLVGLPLRQQPQHLDLALGEHVGILRRAHL